jgi:hypothetical protein
VAARGLNTGSEAEPQSEAEVTLILFGRAGDIAEVGGSDITPRIREVRRVGEIIGLSPEFQLETFSEREAPEQAQVEICSARPSQSVPC